MDTETPSILETKIFFHVGLYKVRAVFIAANEVIHVYELKYLFYQLYHIDIIMAADGRKLIIKVVGRLAPQILG